MRAERGRWGSQRAAPLWTSLVLAAIACAGLQSADLEPAGRLVEGRGGAYALEIPNDEWLRAPAEADETEAQPDFHLARRSGSGWIRAWSRKEQRLDEIVWERRSALLESGAFNYNETRYWIGDDERITVSLSRYISGGELVLVLVALRAPYAVEIIAAADRAGGTERELLQILESVRFRGTRP